MITGDLFEGLKICDKSISLINWKLNVESILKGLFYIKIHEWIFLLIFILANIELIKDNMESSVDQMNGLEGLKIFLNFANKKTQVF